MRIQDIRHAVNKIQWNIIELIFKFKKEHNKSYSKCQAILPQTIPRMMMTE